MFVTNTARMLRVRDILSFLNGTSRRPNIKEALSKLKIVHHKQQGYFSEICANALIKASHVTSDTVGRA